jgi:hypothetical protein
MTISYEPSDDMLNVINFGAKMSLRVLGNASDARGQGVAVQPHVDIANTQDIFHVTMTCANGTGAVYTNTLLSHGFTPVHGDLALVLNGTICAHTRDATAPLICDGSQLYTDEDCGHHHYWLVALIGLAILVLGIVVGFFIGRLNARAAHPALLSVHGYLNADDTDDEPYRSGLQ